MKILIFGNGQIGNFFKNNLFKDSLVLEEIAIATNVDITQIEEIRHMAKSFEPDIIINTSAKTNLEWCEANPKGAYAVNVEGAKNVADVCEEEGIYLVHFSSGCIFESVDVDDVKEEYSEVSPASYYSWTKVWGERLVRRKRKEDFKFLILRPRQPVSAQITYKNMLVKFLTFTQFVDTPNTGTVIEDLVEWSEQLIWQRYHGIVNVANSGWSTPYTIAQMLKAYVLPSLPIEMITKAQLDAITPTKRVDTVLDVSLLESLVREVRPYEEAVEDTVKKLAINIGNMKKTSIKRELMQAVSFTKQRAVPNEAWRDLT